jgi:acyl-coenzyme A thioesterase PaaI-like protein
MSSQAAGQMENLLHQILPLVKAIGFKVEDTGPGFAKTSMSRAPLIVNHVGAFHAGALYTFAETAAGAAIAASFDLFRYTLINKRGEIKYLKLVKEKVTCDASFSKEEIERITLEVEEKGKAVFPFAVYLKNPDGEIASEVVFDFYLRKNQ